MARQPLGEQARRLRAMGLAWVLAPAAKTGGQQPTAQPAPPPRRRAAARPAPRAAAPAPAASPPPLPQVLRALFHGKQCPLHTLWTYAALWEDLHLPRPPRLELVKKIQGACSQRLGWDAARMALWPCQGPQPDLWTLGLERFRPRHVLAFGAAAVGRLHPHGQTPNAPFSLGEVLVVPLPDLDAMLAGDATAKAAAWECLRRLADGALDTPTPMG